jgi:hypothetical protein
MTTLNIAHQLLELVRTDQEEIKTLQLDEKDRELDECKKKLAEIFCQINYQINSPSFFKYQLCMNRMKKRPNSCTHLKTLKLLN